MAITLVNPEGLTKVDLYRQVSVATGSRMVFLAGQVAWDADGVTVGEGDFAAQVEQCYLNVGTALAEVGASFDDVVKLTVYLVDWTRTRCPCSRKGSHAPPRSWGSPPPHRSPGWESPPWPRPTSWSRSKPRQSSTEVDSTGVPPPRFGSRRAGQR